MALPLTREGIFTIAPSRGSMLSQVSVKDHAPSQKLIHLRVTERDEGFAAAMINDLASGSVRQRVLFASLPNGDVVCLETLVALKECVVESVKQGYLQVMNEDFPLIEGNCDAYRTLHHPDGEEKFRGFVSASPEDDIAFSLGHPGWLNVDDRMGIVFSGTGKTLYINRHYFKPYRAIADDLYLSVQDENGEHNVGETIAELAFLLCPEQPHDKTPDQHLEVISSEKDAVCLIAPGYLCALSSPMLSHDEQASSSGYCEFSMVRDDLIPIFPGTTEIDKDHAKLRLQLFAGQAIFSETRFYAKTDGSIEVTAVPGPIAFLTNRGEDNAEVQIIKDSITETILLKAGQITQIAY